MSKMQDVQDWLRKYLFWCLCGAIAIFSLAAWWFGVGTLTTKSKANLAEIETNFKKPGQVTETFVTGNIHPNEKVNSELTKLTLDRRKTVLQAWDVLYKKHQPIYKWPEILDQKFKEFIKENPWNKEIHPDQRVEYQTKVKLELKRIITEVANAEWPGTTNTNSSGTSFGVPPRSPEEAAHGAGTVAGLGVPGVSEKLLWDQADITTYINRYSWTPPHPYTTEVRLAQEDLWVLEQLCRVIAQVNGQTPPYQRPIKVVKKIAIEGYALDAGEKFQPHGMNSNRILRAAPATAAPMGEDAEAAAATADAGAAEGAPAASARPERLGGNATHGGGEALAPAPDAAEPPADGAPKKEPGDELYEWRYIDHKGFPLSKAQLDSTNKNDLYRMMPFKIQMHILQSSMPKLFEAFKEAPLTMEITQIRINPETNAASQFANMGTGRTSGSDLGGVSSGGVGTPTGLLPGEVVLEIHGTAYLVQPYDEKKLPLPEGSATENET